MKAMHRKVRQTGACGWQRECVRGTKRGWEYKGMDGKIKKNIKWYITDYNRWHGRHCTVNIFIWGAGPLVKWRLETSAGSRMNVSWGWGLSINLLSSFAQQIPFNMSVNHLNKTRGPVHMMPSDKLKKSYCMGGDTSGKSFRLNKTGSSDSLKAGGARVEYVDDQNISE